MKPLHALSALLLTAAVPTVAMSQTDTNPPPPAATYAAPDQTAPAPSAQMGGVNASTGPIPADQLPPGQASALASGDNRLVTNGPVPDTAANRAKYGGPNSRAGRRTAPAGN